MSHDIVDSVSRPGRIPRGGRVWAEGEPSEDGAVLGQDADVLVGDQEGDGLVFVGAANADVVEAAEVADGDPAGLVDAIVANAVVDRWRCRGGAGLDARVEGV